MSESPTAEGPEKSPEEVAEGAARQMFETMARMQDEHNCQVHPEWRTQGYDYYRAIWVECAELLDHFGWKWWKHQTPDLAQSRLELVDIWHFGLSELIRDEAPAEQALARLGRLPVHLSSTQGQQAAEEQIDAQAFRLAVESLASQTLLTRAFPLDEFVAATAALGMSFQALFELYMGKNVLNRFRQGHGYKEGTYRKLWGGREDNEHLIEAMNELDVGAADYVDCLCEALEARYSASP